MKKDVRLYNIILPVWLMLALPTYLWLLVIPANLAVDTLVSWLTLKKLKHPAPRGVLGHTWWRFWLLGFVADFLGVLWMLAGLLGPNLIYFGLMKHDQVLEGYPKFLSIWDESVGAISHNSFANPWAFLWTAVGAAIAGVCIYVFDKWALKKCALLDERQKHTLALVMAVVTAPWLFFIPIQW